MKTIIAGSRTIDSLELLEAVMERAATHGLIPSEVVSGAARGVDKLGEQWAATHGVPLKRFPADWERLGKSAGYQRNEQMAAYADACIILWDGISRGTKHMARIAKERGLKVYLVKIKGS